MCFPPAIGFIGASFGTDGLSEDPVSPARDTCRTSGIGIYELSPVLLCTSLPAFPFPLLIFLLFFFLFNNPGCIFSLNQTICLLAFLSSNKDSRDPRAPWV